MKAVVGCASSNLEGIESGLWILLGSDSSDHNLREGHFSPWVVTSWLPGQEADSRLQIAQVDPFVSAFSWIWDLESPSFAGACSIVALRQLQLQLSSRFTGVSAKCF